MDRRRPWLLLLGLAASLVMMWLVARSVGPMLEAGTPREVAYSELLDDIDQDRVKSVEIRSDTLAAELKPTDGHPKGEQLVATRLPQMDEKALLDDLRQHGVAFSGEAASGGAWWGFLLGWLLPGVALFLLWRMMFRRIGSAAGTALEVGKSNAKIYDRNEKGKVTFDDVAGVDEAEAELVEVVDYLEHPEKYRALGAKIPKGVLLVGPPGTGKTLLARAVAGEAGVPFFSLSGSEFVEMFVGVGAARMRDLFERAREQAPCIVFIDELDAIGKSRGGLGAMAVNDEREQTLNQLLVEMDGFDPGAGVVIMAATNRPEVLDQALIRPGRFDRQVLVDRPDLKGREDILKVHLRGVKVASDVDSHKVAQRTPGMVGADLANLVNEAALAAARRGGAIVEQPDFEEAIDRLQLGLKKHGRVMSDDEKRRVAFHESGHALVALSVEHSDPVHRVSIIPRSVGALGVTLQLPTEDRYLVTREELRDRICVMLGGRAAEEIVFGDVSTGASNDLERATETARQMVTRFGMSERLGAVTLGRPNAMRFLPGLGEDERNYSDETAKAIDEEVKAIVEGARERALAILTRRRETLDAIGSRLLVIETLEREELESLAGHHVRPDGEHRAPPPSK